MKINRI